MKNCIPILLCCLVGAGCGKGAEDPLLHSQGNTQTAETLPLPIFQPHPDHIIFVWFENKGYSKVIGSSSAPYINSLVSNGTLFTATYPITHPSYPNYIAFFSGATQGVTTDNCIDKVPYKTTNLYQELQAAGKTFAWYSESLPATGSTVCSYGTHGYVEKHNPTTIFTNVPATANKPFSSFPKDYSQLENVVCITPTLANDMHDGTVAQGDAWLKSKLSPLVEWCRTHNSIVVVYFDENDGTDLTPMPVVMIGQHVLANAKVSTQYDHYNWTKTVSSLFGASTTWTPNVASRSVISGCWTLL